MPTLIVGSGVAGLSVAWALRDDPDVAVVEARSRVGGNVHTVDAHGVSVDMGFIVCNPHTYPGLLSLLDDLDVPVTDSDMSLSVQLPDGSEWAGSPHGMVGGGRWRQARAWRRLAGMVALRRRVHALAGPGVTVGDVRDDLGAVVVDDYLAPMIQAVWSAPTSDAMAMPLATLAAFFDQHHLFDLLRRPTWLTVPGGAQRYVRALRARVAATMHTGRAVTAARRVHSRWALTVADAPTPTMTCDRLVLATPPDRALAILDEAADDEQRGVLGAFRTTRNTAVLHTDAAVMPKDQSLWSSWNVQATRDVAVTYWMNRLQPLHTDTNLFVTLNPTDDLTGVVHTETFTHPVLDDAARRAQDRLADVQGRHNVWVCGAWTGYGFHEDGVESGRAVGAVLAGTPVPSALPGRPAGRVVSQARVMTA